MVPKASMSQIYVKVAAAQRRWMTEQTGHEDPSPTFIEDYNNDPPKTAGVGLGIDASASSDYTLESLASLDPVDPLAQQIVQAVLGIENASPTMIRDIMHNSGIPHRSGAPSPEHSQTCTPGNIYLCPCELDGADLGHCTHTQGDVTVLTHEPGVNDLSSGVRPASGESGSVRPVVVAPVSPQDAVACLNNWESLATYQPNRLVSVETMRDLEAFPVRLLERLPGRYYTTITGLLSVLEIMEAQDEEEEGAVDEDVVLYLLMLKGGETMAAGSVVYAEDLVPYVNVGEEGYEQEFWEGVLELRREDERNGVVDLVEWARSGKGRRR